MRILLPDGDSADSSSPGPGSGPAPATVDLHAHYGRAWLDSGGVRVNFISSIDGAAAASGQSRGLQTPGDNAVFAALRDLADVIVVGASTATIEDYRPSRPSAARQAIRQEHGLAPAPAIAVLSSSLALSLESQLYQNPDAKAPTIVVTSSTAPLAQRTDIIDLAAHGAGLQLLETPATDSGELDFAAAIAALRELGYRRILCEGGPRVFSAGVLARSVDELCLSVSPMLAGPGGPRIVGGGAWPESFLPQLQLIGLLLEDDALFCRYRLP